MDPTSRIPKSTETGVRVSRNTHVPLRLPEMLSTARYGDQSRVAMICAPSSGYRAVIRFSGVFLGAAGLAFCCFSYFVNVRKVTRSSRRQFRGYEVVSGNHISFQAGGCVHHHLNSPGPCGVKIYTRNVRQDVEALRVAPETEKGVVVCKIVGANALEWCAELGKRSIGCIRVFRVCFYEKINVLCIAGLRMINHRVTPNDQIPNAMGMEGGQKVFVVLVHRVPSPSL